MKYSIKPILKIIITCACLTFAVNAWGLSFAAELALLNKIKTALEHDTPNPEKINELNEVLQKQYAEFKTMYYFAVDFYDEDPPPNREEEYGIATTGVTIYNYIMSAPSGSINLDTVLYLLKLAPLYCTNLRFVDLLYLYILDNYPSNNELLALFSWAYAKIARFIISNTKSRFCELNEKGCLKHLYGFCDTAANFYEKVCDIFYDPNIYESALLFRPATKEEYDKYHEVLSCGPCCVRKNRNSRVVYDKISLSKVFKEDIYNSPIDDDYLNTTKRDNLYKYVEAAQEIQHCFDFNYNENSSDVYNSVESIEELERIIRLSRLNLPLHSRREDMNDLDSLGVRHAHLLVNEDEALMLRAHFNNIPSTYKILVKKYNAQQLKELLKKAVIQNKFEKAYIIFSIMQINKCVTQDDYNLFIWLLTKHRMRLSLEYYKTLQKLRPIAPTLLSVAPVEDTSWYDYETMIGLLNMYRSSNTTIMDAVDNIDALFDRLNDVRGTGSYVIPMLVNVIDGSFDNPNHWVGLLITVVKGVNVKSHKEVKTIKISYVNPTGEPIDLRIRDQLLDSLDIVTAIPIEIEHVFNTEHHPQYAPIEDIGGVKVIREDGNQDDCGPFLVEALRRIMNGEEVGSMNATDAGASIIYGRQLRNEQRSRLYPSTAATTAAATIAPVPVVPPPAAVTEIPPPPSATSTVPLSTTASTSSAVAAAATETGGVTSVRDVVRKRRIEEVEGAITDTEPSSKHPRVAASSSSGSNDTTTGPVYTYSGASATTGLPGGAPSLTTPINIDHTIPPPQLPLPNVQTDLGRVGDDTINPIPHMPESYDH